MPLKNTVGYQRKLWHPWFSLPPRDSRNRKHGAAYVPILKAGKDNSEGTGGSIPGMKCRRIHEWLSAIEINLHYLLECNPRVIDFREQYPFYHNDEMGRLVRETDGRIPRNKVPTYDVVITYVESPGTERFFNQVVSVKHSTMLREKKVIRRHLREQTDSSNYGWNWSEFTELDVNRVQLENCIHLVDANRYTDIYAQGADALDYATELTRLRRVSSFGAELERMAVRTGCDGKQSLSLFATAVVHGFIAFDFNREWNMKRPLVLKG